MKKLIERKVRLQNRRKYFLDMQKIGSYILQIAQAIKSNSPINKLTHKSEQTVLKK